MLQSFISIFLHLLFFFSRYYSCRVSFCRFLSVLVVEEATASCWWYLAASTAPAPQEKNPTALTAETTNLPFPSYLSKWIMKFFLILIMNIFIISSIKHLIFCISVTHLIFTIIHMSNLLYQWYFIETKKSVSFLWLYIK